MSVLARFGHHDCIARQEVDILGAIPMVTIEYPTSRAPRDHRREKALHGTITAPVSTQRDMPIIVTRPS
jgi:hypothetical protein